MNNNSQFTGGDKIMMSIIMIQTRSNQLLFVYFVQNHLCKILNYLPPTSAQRVPNWPLDVNRIDPVFQPSVSSRNSMCRTVCF